MAICPRMISTTERMLLLLLEHHKWPKNCMLVRVSFFKRHVSRSNNHNNRTHLNDWPRTTHTDPLKFRTIETMKQWCDGNVQFLQSAKSAQLAGYSSSRISCVAFFLYWNRCRFLTLIYLFLNSIHSLNITYSSFFASDRISVLFFVLLNAHCSFSNLFFRLSIAKQKDRVICVFFCCFLFDIYLVSTLWAKVIIAPFRWPVLVVIVSSSSPINFAAGWFAIHSIPFNW